MNQLQKLFERAGYNTRSYSGRGMYGKECLGVVLNRDQDLGMIFGDLIDVLARNREDFDQIFIAECFQEGLRTDSLGLGTILYFPRFPYEETEEEEQEEEV